MFHFKKSPAFTILELLIVIAIVSIMAGVSVYSLSISRTATRDAKRISDISVIRAALSQYWLLKAVYPPGEQVYLGKAGSGADRLSNIGFASQSEAAETIFLDRIPTPPTVNEYYLYTGNMQGYSLKFTMERASAYGKAGVWYAHTTGVDGEDIAK